MFQGERHQPSIPGGLEAGARTSLDVAPRADHRRWRRPGRLLFGLLLSASLTAAAADGGAAAPSAEIVALTHRFFAASDTGDAAAVTSLLHPDFLFARPGGKRLGASEYASLAQRRGGGAVARTFGDESVRVTTDSAVYLGASKTVIQGSASELGLLLVWTRTRDGWRLIHLQPQAAGTEAARERWNAMLKANATDTPSRFLLEVVKGRPPGRALDLGMGNGRNALALAQQGWKVTGVEVAEVGALAAWQAARERNLPNFAVVLQDAQAFEYGVDQYDLVALIYFPVKDYAERVKRALKPGGLVVIEAFHSGEKNARPTGDDVLLELETVKQLFAGYTIVRAETPVDVAEWGKDRRKLVRFAAQKPK